GPWKLLPCPWRRTSGWSARQIGAYDRRVLRKHAPSTNRWMRYPASAAMLRVMQIRFQRTELVNAPPERMFCVLTDYENYPRFNHFVKTSRVLRRDAYGARVVADRATPIAPHVEFEDT